MQKFKYVANIVHKRYGICKLPANLFFSLKRFIIIPISATRNSIQTRAMNLHFSVKKNIGHSALTNSCA